MSNRRITVVTPSYNQGRFLEQTLHSIHNQEHSHIERIVIDGKSTVDSIGILERWSDRIDYWVTESDAGQTDALIKGFGHATGDILYWLNSVDMFEPWTLIDVASFFDNHPDAQVVYGDGTWVDIDGQPLRSKREHPFSRFIFMYDRNFIPQPSTFWRRGLYERVGGLNPTFDLAMDADLFIHFGGVTKIHHAWRPWSRMRLYPEQKNQRPRAQSNREDALIWARYLKPQPRSSVRAKELSARSARVAWKLGTRCYTHSRFRSWLGHRSS